ncbi:Major royal jelly protein/protein yellow [Cinara cedri]|uniref:Major royal jelly protein/protein yellow n=1 Tax=Cinara cedri TaxID=506608 RepID=A0A5E4MVN9_9HEMI|nr:Major royal jelly protein/protein yellow [Cinara cedri]
MRSVKRGLRTDKTERNRKPRRCGRGEDYRKPVRQERRRRRLVKKIDPTVLTNPLSRLQYLAVDYDIADGKRYVYVSDAARRAVIAYDVARSKGARPVLPEELAAHRARRGVRSAGGGPSSLIVTRPSRTNVFAVRTEYMRAGSAGNVADLGAKPDKMVTASTAVLGGRASVTPGFRVSGDSGHGRRHRAVLRVRFRARGVQPGRDQTVRHGRFRAEHGRL